MTRTTLLQQLANSADVWVAAVAERGLTDEKTADEAFRVAAHRQTVPGYLRRACLAALGLPEEGLANPTPLELHHA